MTPDATDRYGIVVFPANSGGSTILRHTILESAMRTAAKSRILSLGKHPVAAEPVDDGEEGRRWAEYFKNLTDEDFGKYKVVVTSNFLKDQPDAAA